MSTSAVAGVLVAEPEIMDRGDTSRGYLDHPLDHSVGEVEMAHKKSFV
jgi:hypothetical protein